MCNYLIPELICALNHKQFLMTHFSKLQTICVIYSGLIVLVSKQVHTSKELKNNNHKIKISYRIISFFKIARLFPSCPSPSKATKLITLQITSENWIFLLVLLFATDFIINLLHCIVSSKKLTPWKTTFQKTLTLWEPGYYYIKAHPFPITVHSGTLQMEAFLA